MATTTSTTSTNSGSSIAYQMGVGSGLDVKNLVESLANAQKAPKLAQIEKRETLNTARISDLAEMSSAIDTFSTALSSLISGGTLFTQPTVSDSAILSAKSIAGSQIGSLAASIEVVQLAKAQVLESTAISSRTAPIGQGSMVLTVGSQTLNITIDSSNDSLEGLAASINGKGMGVQASIVTDANGARLVLKGATGAASAFTLSVPNGTTSGLERFAYGPGVTGGMAAAQTAQDAIVKMDGVNVSRSSNSFSDLIPGVQIDLKKESVPGTTVSLGAERPTTAITQAMEDFVAAYNELQGMIAEKTAAGLDGEGGSLRGDVGVAAMRRQLSQLTSQVLNSGGSATSPKTLAEIGVRTNRDGTLSLDTARLTTMLANDPDGVEALFNPSQTSSNPNIRITSAMGRVKPGTYTLTDLVPASGGGNASGYVNGQAMTGVGTNLVAPSGSAALGLIVAVDAPASSVTITIQSGLGGALKSIRDSLRDTNGAFTTTNKRLTTEQSDIADAKALLEEKSSKYYDQLLNNFVKMDTRVSAYKATQSYLTQQIAMWTNQGNN